MSQRFVQFGCGGNILSGWENHDADVDMSKPLPYETCTVDIVFVEHCLEHLDAHEGFGFLKEAHRILVPGGVLRVCVPVLSNLISRDHASDLILKHGHKMVYSLVTLADMFWAAGFERHMVAVVNRMPCDGHWKVIGLELDDLETLRMEARK